MNFYQFEDDPNYLGNNNSNILRRLSDADNRGIYLKDSNEKNINGDTIGMWLIWRVYVVYTYNGIV